MAMSFPSPFVSLTIFLQSPIVNIEDRIISITNTNIYIFLNKPVIAPASSHSITPSRVRYFPVFSSSRRQRFFEMSIVIHFKILVENSHDRMFTLFIPIFAFGYRILSLNYLELHVHVNFHLDDPMISIAACFFKGNDSVIETQDKSFLSFILTYILRSRNLMVNCFCNICRRQENSS